MKIILYNTTDNNNVINKVLRDSTEFDIKFKDKTDIMKPVVLLHSETDVNFNYAYMENFKRFYFIESIEIFPNNIYSLSLTCDVLESFKDEILKSSGYISQQNENINPYYNTDYETEVKKEVDLYESDTEINVDEKSIILVTVGGVK